MSDWQWRGLNKSGTRKGQRGTLLQDGLYVLALLVRRELRRPQRPAAPPAHYTAHRIAVQVDPRADAAVKQRPWGKSGVEPGQSLTLSYPDSRNCIQPALHSGATANATKLTGNRQKFAKTFRRSARMLSAATGSRPVCCGRGRRAHTVQKPEARRPGCAGRGAA
jgi:hypothetical protein